MNSPWRIFGLEAFKERNLKDKAIRPTVCSFLSTELSERFLADYWLFSWNIMYSVPAALVPCNNANGSLSLKHGKRGIRRRETTCICDQRWLEECNSLVYWSIGIWKQNYLGLHVLKGVYLWYAHQAWVTPLVLAVRLMRLRGRGESRAEPRNVPCLERGNIAPMHCGNGIAVGVTLNLWYCSWWGSCCSFHLGWKNCIGTH